MLAWIATFIRLLLHYLDLSSGGGDCDGETALVEFEDFDLRFILPHIFLTLKWVHVIVMAHKATVTVLVWIIMRNMDL